MHTASSPRKNKYVGIYVTPGGHEPLKAALVAHVPLCTSNIQCSFFYINGTFFLASSVASRLRLQKQLQRPKFWKTFLMEHTSGPAGFMCWFTYDWLFPPILQIPGYFCDYTCICFIVNMFMEVIEASYLSTVTGYPPSVTLYPNTAINKTYRKHLAVISKDHSSRAPVVACEQKAAGHNLLDTT